MTTIIKTLEEIVKEHQDYLSTKNGWTLDPSFETELKILEQELFDIIMDNASARMPLDDQAPDREAIEQSILFFENQSKK